LFRKPHLVPTCSASYVALAQSQKASSSHFLRSFHCACANTNLYICGKGGGGTEVLGMSAHALCLSVVALRKIIFILSYK